MLFSRQLARSIVATLPIGALVLAAACNGDGGGPSTPATADCSDAGTVELAAGKIKVLDPDAAGSGSCVRFPAAGGGGAEYLYTAVATEGTETPTGVEDDYELDAGAAGSLSTPVMAVRTTAPNPAFSAFRRPPSALEFHNRLRRRERELARARGAFRLGGRQAISAAVTKPLVGDSKPFWVCSSSSCDDFVQVTATAKHVGQHVAIYVDNTAPTSAEGGYSQSDLDHVGSLFDSYLYPIDTTAFGRESDDDNNGVVIVLLTPKVNALSGNCSESVILGYFLGSDLENADHSNHGEVFYGIVPDQSSGTSCQIRTDYANSNLPPTFIHEFQHMISYNQHAKAGGTASENGWLNEGLSHFAEELGARQIPDAQCGGGQGDCINEFAVGNLVNAYDYLNDLEQNYLVAPSNTCCSLKERGAAWLFLRWLVDQYGANELGTTITRALVQTKLLGAANVEHVIGQSFSSLVPVWQLANYTDDLTIPGNSRALQYPSWGLRAGFSSFHSQNGASFPDVYPLVPDTITTSTTFKAGLLRAGSGPHGLIEQPANGGAIDVKLTADGSALPNAAIKPRIAIVRLR